VLTAAIYNGDHTNHVSNTTPQGCGSYSTSVPEMKVQTDPYPGASESLASSLAGELERIRYVIGSMKHGTTPLFYWYQNRHAQGDPMFAESMGV